MEVFGLGIRIQEEGSATVDAAIKRLRAELEKTAATANQLGGTMAGLTNRTNGLATSFRTAGATSVQSAGLMESSLRKVGAQFAASYLGVQAFAGGLRMLINTSDTMLLLEGRINLVATGTENLRLLQNRLFESSQLTRSSFGATSELYARVSRNADQLGMSQQQLLNFTELTQMSIRTSGINAIEASRGMIQLSQALASGVLRGDEFRAVMEQMPGLARSIADGLGVPIGSLREMANTGQLSAEKVIAAITKMESKIRSDFTKLPVTIGDGMTRIGNSFANGIRNFNDATGAAEGLGKALSSLANTLERLFGFIANNIEDIKAVAITIGGILLGAFSPTIVAAIGAVGTAIAGVSISGAGIAALFGGPVGIAIAVSIGAFALLNKHLNETKDAFDNVGKSAHKGMTEVLAYLSLFEVGPKTATPLTDEQIAAQEKILDRALEVNQLRLDRLQAERDKRFGAMPMAQPIVESALNNLKAQRTPMGVDWFDAMFPALNPSDVKLFDMEAMKSEISLQLGELGKFMSDNAKFNAQIAAENMQASFAEGIGGAIQSGVEQGLTAAIMSGRISNLWKGLAQSLVAGLAKVMVDFAIKSKVFGQMMETINKFLQMGNGLGAVIAATALLAFGYANGGKATMGNTSVAGGAGGLMTGISGSALPTQQIIFGATSATTAAGMTPRQSMNVTVIGPNDPSAQRAIQELMTKANSRGRIG